MKNNESLTDIHIIFCYTIIESCHTNKPSFKASNLAVSIASSLEICNL
jgi:hypothetical protein